MKLYGDLLRPLAPTMEVTGETCLVLSVSVYNNTALEVHVGKVPIPSKAHNLMRKK